MKALPSDGGWGGMSDLTTHFFEHNSMDANGNALDLSKRTNSPSSVNSYSPILPAEYADHFTPRNVLGGIDSWDAEACVEECAAPAPATDEKGDIVWNKVDGASGYLVFYNGNFVAYTPELSYAPADNQDPKLFTLAAINPNGCRGKMSVAPQTTAVDSFNVEEAAVEYFNLQGVRISGDVKGAVIKVTRTADGKIKSEKIFNK